uniref:YadA C-terminal domain-containing protein n=1 Tax=Dialister micraerophilus TaxID=309120 RepID=UPI0023F09129
AGKKITYAINKDKLVKYIAGDLIKQMNGEGTPGSGDHGTPGSGNPSGHGTGEQGQTTPLPVLTNVSTGFNIAVGDNSKNFTFGKGKETNKLTFAGTNDETVISLTGEDGTPTITVGLADTFKTKVENKADKDELTKLETKVNNITNGTTNIEGSNIDLSTNNTFKALKTSVEGKANADGSNVTTPATWAEKLGTGTVAENNKELVTGGTVHTALQGKADTNASNLTKAEDILAWKKKLGLVDAQATQDSTTNISTQVTNINNDITNLKGGFIVSDGTKSKEITLGGTTKDKLTFASADKNLTATFNETNKTISYGVNVANLIGDINKSSTKITNVDLTNNQTITNLKTEIQNITNNGTTSMNGINFYLGGTSSGTTYTPSAKAEDKWQSSRIVFGEGLKAEKLKDAGNIEYTKISATGGGQGGKSAYEIWRDHKDDKGLTPNSNKSETEFLDSLKGQSGIKGADGKDGKSAYEVWRDYKEGNDSQPNKDKSEKDFMNYMKGKDCSADIQHIADNVTKGLSVMDGRINRVSAGAAALSALHPISNEYDPDDKLDFSVGFGYYKGENAVAIGAYYRPDSNTIVSLGGAFNGDDNLLNAGISFKLGKGNEAAMLSKKVLLGEVIRLTRINKEMAAKIELQEEKIAHQESMISEQDARLKKIEALLAVK